MAEVLSNAEFQTILKSPTLFMWKMLGIKPLPFQVEILEDDSKNVIIVGGRQIGKSLTLAAKALWNAFVKTDQDIIIVAQNLRQAKVVFDHIYRYVSTNILIKKHTRKLTITEIKFDNNSIIRCLPAGRTGEGIRGFTATMIIFDEAAFIPDEVFVSLEPSLGVKGSQAIYSSTPYGKRGYFYQLYATEMAKNQAHRDFSIYVVPTTKNPYFSKQLLDRERQIKTPLQFTQEYEAQFVDESGLFFPFSLIFSCAEDYEYRFPADISSDEKYYLGLDVAYSGEDDTAITILREFANGNRMVQYVETISKSSVPELVGKIINMSKSIKFERIYVDKTGVGAGIYDLLRTSLGSVVYGVEFTEHNRDTMYGNLRLALEQKTIKLNRNDTKFLYQFSSYTAKYDVIGKLRLSKDVNIHDDLVDSLAVTFIDKGGGTIKVVDMGLDFSLKPNLDTRPFIKDAKWFVIGDFPSEQNRVK